MCVVCEYSERAVATGPRATGPRALDAARARLCAPLCGSVEARHRRRSALSATRERVLRYVCVFRILRGTETETRRDPDRPATKTNMCNYYYSSRKETRKETRWGARDGLTSMTSDDARDAPLKAKRSTARHTVRARRSTDTLLANIKKLYARSRETTGHGTHGGWRCRILMVFYQNP